MYGSYTSSSLTLRAKWSFSYNHHYFLNDRVENCTSSCITETIPPSCTAFPIHGFPLNPRFLFGYCLRQSTLIQWSHSRRFVLGGAATGARYCRLTAHDIERDRRVPRLPKDRGRRGSSVSCRIRDSDESFQEILGLLAEVEGCYRESIGVEFGYSGRKLKGEDTIKAVNGEDRKCDSRENKHRARKDGLSSSYYSGSGYEDDVVEGEVQEVWKYEDDVRREGTNDSKYRERESSCRKGSERKIRDREEKVASSMDSARQAREEYIREEQHAVGQRELRGGSRKLTRVSEVSEDDTRRASSSKNLVNARNEDREERVYGWESDSRRDLRKESELREKDSNMRASSSQKVSEWKIRDREEKTASLMASAREAREEYIQEEQRRIGERESREGSQKLMRVSEAGEDDTKRASSFKNVVDSRREEREESSISAVKRHSEIDQRFVGLAESRKSSQKLTERLEIHDSKTERASNSQRRFDTRVEDKEDKTTIAQNLVQVARDRRTEMDIKKQYKSHTNVSGTHTSDTETASSSQRLLDSGTDDQEECLGSGANLGYGVNEQQNQTDERVPRPLRSKKEFEKNTSLSEHSRSNIERVSNTQKITSTRMDNQEENVSSISVQGLKEKGIGTHSEERRTSLSTQRETASSGNLDSNSSYVYPHFHELDDQTRKDEMYLVKNDALESARRLDNSSALYVGEFVDQVQQEISTSDELDVVSRRYSGVQMEEVHGGTSQTTTGLQQSVVDATTKNIDERYIKESARQSSATSGLKGPSDEMWDVHGFSSQERSRVEPEEDSSAVGVVDSTTSLTNSENDITRRSHRSLWTSIADIIRKGWGSRGESHNLTLQSGIRSSSNESLSSEAWFSGHELDENDDDSDKKERSSTPKESVPINRPIDQSHPKAHPVPSRGASKMTRSEDRITKLEADTSTSMGTTKRASASKGASPVNPPENIRLIKRERGRQGSPNIVTVDQSSTLVGGAASHTIEEEVINIGNIQITGSGIIISKEESIREKLPEVGGTDGKDGELKRRKLQRNKQVLKEQFDEWEEAYKFESEQRKIDEIFMREALLEAKKAADTWEVPVGAVLVQNGKIIARGRNLVEELRDSTAHAEMICIREASNLLRTWRLAETTLYVTLEPCAMCAGAILQARVDAVVWGAPNKLLGADGSWVRLFPGGDGGRNSLDPSTETAGPVHPFHPKITIRRGILSTECSDVMQQFFQLRRKKDKKPEPPPPSCLPISTHPTKLVTKMHDLFSMMFCL